MRGLYFLIPTFLAVAISFLVVRGAAIALMLTGLDLNRAKFQALSAFTGTGFTTKEAESVVNHPTRRKIVSWLMILGNAGIVAVIVTTTSSFVFSRSYNIPLNGLLLVSGLFILYKLATRKKLITGWESYIEKRLMKTSAFEEGSTEDLLHLIEGYGLVRTRVAERSHLVGKTLIDFRLPEQGILILGIERDRNWLPIPKATESIRVNDIMIAYGALAKLREVFEEEAQTSSGQ